jgi:DNA modification methylase
VETSLSPDDSDDTIRENSSRLIEVEGDIDPNFDIPNQGKVLIISNDQSYLTHGIHKFPAKFFPELPRYLIRKYSKSGEAVLDPMCGSGTVVLEAMLNNRSGIGIDIDPIAKLITRVKTTPINPEILDCAARDLTVKIQELDNRSMYTPQIPEFHYRDKWFRSFVLRELAVINDSIDSVILKHHDGPVWQNIGDFFRVVLSSIIRDVSNADSHCTRTVLRKKVIKKISPGDTYVKFSQTLIRQCSAMSELFSISKNLVINDVQLPKGTAIETGLDSDSIDLAITSPPYINAVDYPRTHQLEMYWLGLLDNSPLSQMKRKYIGTETVYKSEYEKLNTSGPANLDLILERIYERDPRRSYIVFKFFSDMEKQLHEMYRVLKPGSRYCIAIGNNLIRGVEVRSDKILSELAISRVGFQLEKSFFSKLIRHFIRIPRPERMLGEWVLVLKK